MAYSNDLTKLTPEEFAKEHPDWAKGLMSLDDTVRVFVPGQGLWVGTIGWAVAPDYMAARAKAKAEEQTTKTPIDSTPPLS